MKGIFFFTLLFFVIGNNPPKDTEFAAHFLAVLLRDVIASNFPQFLEICVPNCESEAWKQVGERLNEYQIIHRHNFEIIIGGFKDVFELIPPANPDLGKLESFNLNGNLKKNFIWLNSGRDC